MLKLTITKTLNIAIQNSYKSLQIHKIQIKKTKKNYSNFEHSKTVKKYFNIDLKLIKYSYSVLFFTNNFIFLSPNSKFFSFDNSKLINFVKFEPFFSTKNICNSNRLLTKIQLF